MISNTVPQTSGTQVGDTRQGTAEEVEEVLHHQVPCGPILRYQFHLRTDGILVHTTHHNGITAVQQVHRCLNQDPFR